MRSIFVDGASLGGMRRAIGIGQFNFFALFDALSKMGTEELAHRPVFVLPPAQGMLEKSLRTAGFDVKVVGTDNSADDDYIKGLIEETDAIEIQIVSADQDFAPLLRDKAKAGKSVIWVATRLLDQGISVMSPTMEPLFESGEFKFYDLADFKTTIMRAAWKEMGRSQDQGRSESSETKDVTPSRSVRAEISMQGYADECSGFLAEVVALLSRFPNTTFKIEG